MNKKKMKSKAVENKRFDFFLVGLSISLLLVLGAFSYTKTQPKPFTLEESNYEGEEIEIIENTVHAPKPKPLPPPEVKMVEDEEIIEEDNPELVIFEPDQDTEILDYADVDEEIIEETGETIDIIAIEDKPLFMGKDASESLPRYLAENLKYPFQAKENAVSGVVVVKFVVNTEGEIEDVQIVTPKKGFGLEEEAIKVILSTSGNWTAGKQNNKPVKVRYQIPINFQLN
ncbi:TonB family protein [bacterium]|nr:TonB family protein [bacterium]